MLSANEHYRLSSYSCGRRFNFPYAISGALEQNTVFKGRSAREFSKDEGDFLLIPAKLYSKELHAEILRINQSSVNRAELFIEHGVIEKSRFRSTSGVPRQIEMIKAELLPTEVQLQQNRPWWEKFFSSTTGTVAIFLGLVGAAGLVYFNALKEQCGSQAQPPQPAAAVNNLARQGDIKGR